MSEKIEIGGLQIEVLRKKSLKNMYIRINPPEGDVVVSAPADATDEEIRLLVLKRMPDISKVRGRMNAQPRQSKREYVSGEAFYLWGKPYMLQVVDGGNGYKIEKKQSKIVMTVPDNATDAGKEKAITEWYRAELRRVLDLMFQDCMRKTGIIATEARIKNMRTRWGTCNVDERRIWINLQLVKKPQECLEYIIIHELVTLLWNATKRHLPSMTSWKRRSQGAITRRDNSLHSSTIWKRLRLPWRNGTVRCGRCC